MSSPTALTGPAATVDRDTRARLPITGHGVGAVLAPLVFGIVVIGLWELAIKAFDVEPLIIPAPSAIASEVHRNWEFIYSGMKVTGRNALIGMLAGALIGVVGAVIAASVRIIDQMAVPVVAALSVVPIVALAPVLYTMYGAAVDTARIVVAGIAVSVPVYLNTLRGLRQVTPVHRDLMAAYAAGPMQVARAVTLPTAMPYVFTGLRIASSLAVISALIAEYFGGPIGGLGKSITSSAASSKYATAYSYVVGAIILGLAFYVATLLIELWFSRHRGRT
ncbi:ABC transporter permease [soil metagenome]